MSLYYAFIQFQGVTGGSTDSAKAGWIEIFDFSLSIRTSDQEKKKKKKKKPKTVKAVTADGKTAKVSGPIPDEADDEDEDEDDEEGGDDADEGEKGSFTRPVHDEFEIKKYLDKSSPTLYLDAASGKVYSKVTVEFYRGGATRILHASYLIENVFISSIKVKCGDGGDKKLPEETIKLKYHKIKWTINQVDSALGTIKSPNNIATWNFTANTP